MNSKGHLFVYTRTGTSGISRGGKAAAMLFEFDEKLKFVKIWGPNNYALSFAHNVRVDKYDNVWMDDEGSGMIVKFDPSGMVKMTLGRKTEAIDYLQRFVERDDKDTNIHPVGTMGTFNRETDIAWDPQGNMYISDGYGNSRVVKISKEGVWLKAVGTYGNGQDQFNTVHSIAVDPNGNVYVADRGNNRIQVYDYDLNFKKTITGMGQPWGIQVTPKYLYSGSSTGKSTSSITTASCWVGRRPVWATARRPASSTNCTRRATTCSTGVRARNGTCRRSRLSKAQGQKRGLELEFQFGPRPSEALPHR